MGMTVVMIKQCVKDGEEQRNDRLKAAVFSVQFRHEIMYLYWRWFLALYHVQGYSVYDSFYDITLLGSIYFKVLTL